MEVIHVMTHEPESIGPDDMLAQAQQIMNLGNFRRLPVVKDRGVVGIITERCLRGQASYLEATKVNAVMSSPVITVGSRTAVEEAAKLMLHHKIGGMPVVDHGKLVGIITTSDILRAFLQIVGAAAKPHSAA